MNKIVAVDTETTGLTPAYHEVIDLAIVPLTFSFDLDKSIPPLVLQIRPTFPDRAEADALAVNKYTIEQLMERPLTRAQAIDQIFDWRTTHYGRRKLEPVAQNWAFDRDFIQQLIAPHNIRTLFGRVVRDTQRCAQLFNDRAVYKGQKEPFEYARLTSITAAFEIQHEAHTAYGDAVAAAMAYQKFVQK